MDIIITEKTLDDIICFWIETTYISRQLDNLVEYTDEVGELYDAIAWVKDNQTGDGNSVMDIHVLVEQAGEKSDKIMDQAEDNLKAILKTAYDTDNKIFDSYKFKNIDDSMEKIFEFLYDSFDDIYDYNQEEQVKNFYKIFDEILKKINK